MISFILFGAVACGLAFVFKLVIPESNYALFIEHQPKQAYPVAFVAGALLSLIL